MVRKHLKQFLREGLASSAKISSNIQTLYLLGARAVAVNCVLSGRMTPDQKQIVRKRAIVDTQLFIDILTWFVNESGHPGYQDFVIPEECPQPLFVEDKETQNNTDESVNVNLETNIESGTYYFSSAQEPSDNTSVYGSSDKFALAMFQRSAPTLLAYGGTYANTKELNIENILPFAFPFWYWWPKDEKKSESLS